IMETAALVRESGAVMLRGGAYKPRTSPYAFQGLGMQGLEYMKEAGDAYGMPIVTEVVSPELALQMKDLTDMFQIGARNMQNFELLKKVGSIGKPVLLKRGPSATIEEWLLSAEYLLASGTQDVILCERGIRTFETYTRNTLDISAIPVVKKLSHLPVIVDPSHAVGIRSMVSTAALAAIAAGANGLTVEVHPRPEEALSDGPQSLYPEQFEKLMRDVEALAPVVGKELLRTPGKVGFSSRYVSPGIGLKTTGSTGTAKSSGADSATTEKGAAAAQSSGTSARSSDTAGAGGTAENDISTTGAPVVAFSGESGAYADQAIIRAFGEESVRLSVSSFKAVFDAVLEGRAQFGMVPIENSLAGSVHENYDLFIRYPDIAIVGEIKLRIVHCLIGNQNASLDTIRVVRSHPQGFAQCKDFLDKHPEWILEPATDTGGAVASIARSGSPEVAAIAGEVAARLYNLKIIKEGIETNPLNYTRFFMLSRRIQGTEHEVPSLLKQNTLLPPGYETQMPNKASIVFSTPNEPGSLFACLKILSDRGINMSKLESRPIPGKPWRYMFYVDISIPEEEQIFDIAMEELKTKTEDFQFLGAYRASL
ncbi:MAG: 3-deoxy-7-phosphoheptulonate synthase, partial [Termitinemataceae bacterium]